MTQQRPEPYAYPQSVVDWRFVVNSGQFVDLTSPVPARQQWVHGQPPGAQGSASHAVVAPQLMQSVHRYGPLQVPQMVQHSPVIDLDAEQASQECNRDTVESSPQQVHDQHMEYSVKVVPPDRKAGYQVHKLRVYMGKKFVNVEELKSQLQKSLKEHVSDENDMNFGYIEPSKQGVRGKMRWIFTADDLKDMYTAYEQKSQTEVLLWCDGRKVVKDDEVPQPKRAHVAAENGSKKKTPAVVSQSKKLGEVQEIYEKLHSKHTSYDQERLRMWAHLIQMGKHDSYEVPPNQPFFKDTKSQKKTKTADGPAQDLAGACISPVKRSNLRSAYMSQIKEWHSLFKDGAITEDEYEQQKEKILGDLGKL